MCDNDRSCPTTTELGPSSEFFSFSSPCRSSSSLRSRAGHSRPREFGRGSEVQALDARSWRMPFAPADRYQRVDGHDPGLQRRVDRRAFHDRRSPAFDRPTPDGANPAAFVERAAEGIHDPSQQRLPDRDVHDPVGAAHDLSCPDLHAVLEHDDADPVPVEFQGQPEPPGLELNDLLCADGGQP